MYDTCMRRGLVLADIGLVSRAGSRYVMHCLSGAKEHNTCNVKSVVFPDIFSFNEPQIFERLC